MAQRSLLGVVISRIFGIFLFLIILVILNLLTAVITNQAYLEIVGFLNSNILLILIIGILFFIGDVFSALIFPFNLPAPVFNAFAAVFLLSFLFDVFEYLSDAIGFNLNITRGLSFFLYPLVFLLVLVLGYVSIFTDFIRGRRHDAHYHHRH